MDRLLLSNKLDEQKTRQKEILAWADLQEQNGCPQSRDTANRTHAVYQREVDRLVIDIHNLDMQLLAYSAAFPEEGGRPDGLEHAQLTALNVDLPRSSSSTFAQQAYEAPVKVVQLSDFAQAFYAAPLKVLAPESTDEAVPQAAVVQGVSSMERLARTGDVLITDADSTITEQAEQ